MNLNIRRKVDLANRGGGLVTRPLQSHTWVFIGEHDFSPNFLAEFLIPVGIVDVGRKFWKFRSRFVIFSVAVPIRLCTWKFGRFMLVIYTKSNSEMGELLRMCANVKFIFHTYVVVKGNLLFFNLFLHLQRHKYSFSPPHPPRPAPPPFNVIFQKGKLFNNSPFPFHYIYYE